ncbi:uncharacterized protein LOC132196033 [Neocloeon triangulifer]|uniref:uncharacterized protein LOC132196033 n=1 Tax=Neocloeon triangulifer TaxID=2078957 RepID=UPI00286F4E3C|nr:uncharacterized protein LOC132196033 [Neocloeon triangulifer]
MKGTKTKKFFKSILMAALIVSMALGSPIEVDDAEDLNIAVQRCSGKGLQPHPFVCHKFLYCFNNDNSEVFFPTVVLKCPSGYAFSDSIKNCAPWEEVPNCASAVNTSESIIQSRTLSGSCPGSGEYCEDCNTLAICSASGSAPVTVSCTAATGGTLTKCDSASDTAPGTCSASSSNPSCVPTSTTALPTTPTTPAVTTSTTPAATSTTPAATTSTTPAATTSTTPAATTSTTPAATSTTPAATTSTTPAATTSTTPAVTTTTTPKLTTTTTVTSAPISTSSTSTSTSTTALPATVVPSTCSTVGANIVDPQALNCKTYYSCTSVNGVLKYVLNTCLANMAFDPIRLRCLNTFYVTCPSSSTSTTSTSTSTSTSTTTSTSTSTSTSSTTSKPTTVPPCSAVGVQTLDPSTAGCQAYSVCTLVNGVLSNVRMTCPAFMAFSTKYSRCLNVVYVTC